MNEVRELTKNRGLTKDYGNKRAVNRLSFTARPGGRGELITEISTPELTERFRRDVFVRSPRRSGLTRVLTGMGARVLAEPGGGLSVTGMDAWRIVSAAAAHYIPIQELTPRSVSLDDSYLELADASIENRGQRQTARAAR